MLTLRLEFLTGRYCASLPANRNKAEWPPHPARVFSALVAAHYEGESSDAGRAALQWLEQQPAPQLHFSPLSPDELEVRDLFENYVPVNDKALTDASTVANAWAKLRAANNEKQQAKAEKQLSDAYAKVAERQGSLSKNAAAQLAHLLPETRTRQARTFPTVIPHDPIVWFGWDAQVPEEHLDALRKLSRTLARVGHSSSLVSGSWTAEPPPSAPTLVPDPQGDQTLRWVESGQLDALDSLHQRSPYAEQRVMPTALAQYALAGDSEEVPHSRFSDDLIVLRRVAGPRVSSEHTEFVTEAVRGALMRHGRQPVSPCLSGHHEQGAHGEHIAVLALCNVGQPYASGDILGVALARPRSAAPDELAAIYTAVANWERDGYELRLGRLGVWRLEREVLASELRTLQGRAWTQASRVWSSVTPVLLDRHPGDLRSAKPSRSTAGLRQSRNNRTRRVRSRWPAGAFVDRVCAGPLSSRCCACPPLPVSEQPP